MLSQTRIPATWLASMAEMKRLSWVALEAMTPGTMRRIRAFMSGVSFRWRGWIRAPLIRAPHQQSAAWLTPATITPMQAAKAESVDRWNEYQSDRLKFLIAEQGIRLSKDFAATGADAKAQIAQFQSDMDHYQANSKADVEKAKTAEASYDALNVHDDQFDMSDAFIALPGGIGTLEGFFEILTWGQLGIHAKPSGILNVAGYFDALSGFLYHAVREGFLTEAHRNAIIVESSPDRLLERLRAYTPPEGEKFMGRTNR